MPTNFRSQCILFGLRRRGLAGYNGLQGPCLVSSAVKGESDEAFLTFRTLRFNQAEDLAGFIEQLTPASAERLRSLEIGICTLCKYQLQLVPHHGRRILQITGVFGRASCSKFSLPTAVTAASLVTILTSDMYSPGKA